MDGKVEPRPPGLWMFQNGEITEDSAEVDKAEAHLIQLLSDPYYAEAFQRLRRRYHPSVKDRDGVLPTQKGELAARRLRPLDRSKKSLPGAPEKDRAGFIKMLEGIERAGNKLSLRKWCELIVRNTYPAVADAEREKFTTQIYQIFLDQRKKQKKLKECREKSA